MYRYEAWIIAALLTMGVVGAVIYNWPTAPTAVDETTESELANDLPTDSPDPQGFSLIESVAEQPIDAVPSLSLDPLRRGDSLLRGGNYIGAFQQFKTLSTNAQGTDAALSVRLGIASEMSGFLDQAESHYLLAVKASAADSMTQVHGLTGVARVWEKMERFDDSINLLSELFLIRVFSKASDRDDPSEPTDHEQPIRDAIVQRLAEALQKRRLKSDADSRKPSLEYAWSDTPVESILQSVDQLATPPKKVSRGNELTVIQNPTSDVSLMLVDAHLPNQSCLELIDELQQSTRMQFTLTPDARAALVGRTIRVEANAMPVSTLMDEAFGRWRLAWSQTTNTVYIRHVAEIPKQRWQQYQTERIARLHQLMLFNLPNDHSRAAALMNDANNAVLASSVGADEKYAAARELGPRGELNAKLHYNEAHFALASGQTEMALDRFYRALDQSLSPRIRSLAFGMIADLELRLGRPDKAIVAASRGVHAGKSPELAQRSLVTLVKAYLLQPDPLSANRVLHENSAAIADESIRRMVSLFGTYARFQVTAPTDGLQDEGQRLVLALAAMKPTDPADFIEHMIVARAMNEVGFGSKATEHLQAAAKGATDPFWKDRLQLELAAMLSKAQEHEAAGEAIDQISFNAPLSLRIRMLQAKADNLFQRDQPAECINICKSLLQMPIGTEVKLQTLDLMGRSYRKSDQHYSAALCFAGLLPETVDSAEPPSSR